jgi:hypothetical protein
MSPSALLTRQDIDLSLIEKAIREEGKPLHINQLAKVALRAHLESAASERCYAPAAAYQQGERIRFRGELCTVKVVRPGGNPVQGQFTIITLEFRDGRQRHMAAQVQEPNAPADDRIPVRVTDEDIAGVLHGPEGQCIRNAVQDALSADLERFAWFQDHRGDYWCHADLLREHTFSTDEVSRARDVLLNAGVNPVSTSQLLRTLRGADDDGSDSYDLLTFALNVTLNTYQDFRWMGTGWILESEWQSFQRREPLVGPTQHNTVRAPDGVKPLSLPDNESVIDEPDEHESEPLTPPPPVAVDLESWLRDRADSATITLQATHYYRHTLPLTGEMRRLFPPLESGSYAVTFHYQFGTLQGEFPAYVDYSSNCILADKTMYDVFYECGVYPGARLSVSRHENLWDYDIRTRPITPGQTVRVRRVFLTDDGQLEYEEQDESMRYEVDRDVFVAAARWEDLPALFKQAEQAGAGVFQLMYQACCKWWEERGRQPLDVTGSQLFEAIHHADDGRLTSRATIQWELWRRAAFKSLGQGVYRFHPEYEDRLCISLGGRRPPKVAPPRAVPRAVRIKRLPTPPQAPVTPPPVVPVPDTQPPEPLPTPPALWAQLQAEPERMAALEAAVRAYVVHPTRQPVLLFRRHAHARIRQLLARDALDSLTLDAFNTNVWQIGAIHYQGKTYTPAEPGQIIHLLADLHGRDPAEALESGDIQLTGNQTWGSGSHVFGPSLNATEAAKLDIVVTAIRHLLYDDTKPLLDRLLDTLFEPNGLGINSVTGILNALSPHEHVLYNEVSVDALNLLGLADVWPSDWRRDVATYPQYLELCKHLRKELGFEDLTDLDWFIYLLSKGIIPFDTPKAAADAVVTRVVPAPPTSRIDSPPVQPPPPPHPEPPSVPQPAADPVVTKVMQHKVDTTLLQYGVVHLPSDWYGLLVRYLVDEIDDITIVLPNGERIDGAQIRPYAPGGQPSFRLAARSQAQLNLLRSLKCGQELHWRFLFHRSKVEIRLIPVETASADLHCNELLVAYTLGLIAGKGRIPSHSDRVHITLQYGPYKHGRITGGGISFDERTVLPQGAKQVSARLEQMCSLGLGLHQVTLLESSIYKYVITLQFSAQSELLRTIRRWYPEGTSYADFRFPVSMLSPKPASFAREFTRGYACATGLITDATRAGLVGRHRVYLRASANNREVLNDVRWLLEDRLGVPVAHIFWHEGRDPQMRIWAEDFLAIGFGIDWIDAILDACARQNQSQAS